MLLQTWALTAGVDPSTQRVGSILYPHSYSSIFPRRTNSGRIKRASISSFHLEMADMQAPALARYKAHVPEAVI